MSLKSEIKPFTDGNNLVAPQECDPTVRGSDNGPLFTSEYHILLELLEESLNSDADEWQNKIDKCMLKPGLLSRAPNDVGQEGPDDMIGVLAAAKVLNRPELAQQMLSYGHRHLGWFNNENPGTTKTADGKRTNWQAFQWRQLQLLGATWCAADKLGDSFNLFVGLLMSQRLFILGGPLFYKLMVVYALISGKIWQLPVMLYTALIIATSCIKAPKDDADSRILAWCLIKATNNSILCQFAAKIWTRRLMRDYPDGMRGVFALYFPENHPIRKYMIEV